MSHKTKEDSCPTCHHLLDTATGINSDNQPKPGDYSLCAYCGQPLIYDKDLFLRAIEMTELPMSVRDIFEQVSIEIKLMIQYKKKIN